jgi:hypothetical protein
MKNVYIDESGYTGADLLNEDQPFQAAAAISISEEEAKAVIDKFFPNKKMLELKYKNLAKQTKNWENLLLLQKELLQSFDCVTYICDKKFVLILQFIDYAVEPFYYDRGTNLYKDGVNYALASLVYYTGETMLGEKNFNDILRLFQHAMKSKTDIAVYGLIEKIKNTKWEELSECFGPLALATPSCIEAIQTKGVSTDAALIVLLALINKLETIFKNDYHIYHDRSKNLEQYNKILNKMIDHEDNIEFKISGIASVKFPLSLKSVTQVDSKDFFGVQLADVLVGGIIDASKAITKKKINEYNQEILKLYRDGQIIHMLPNINFTEQKNFRMNTQGGEFIDYVANNFG